MESSGTGSESSNEKPAAQPAGVPTVDPATGAVSSQPVTMGSSVETMPSTEGVMSSDADMPKVSQPEVTPLGGSGLPMVSAATVGGMSASGGKKRSMLFVAVAIAAVLVLAAAGYVFAFFLPNRPSAVYSTGLTNSGKAIDSLISYGTAAAKKSYKSYNFTGTANVKSSGMSFDGTLTGAFDENANGTVSLKTDIMGQKIDAELRTVRAANTTSPDLYLQVSGIKQALDEFGMSSFDNLDGKWISVDHTLLDTYAANLSGGAAADALSASTMPTSAQVDDALTKVQATNKKYIFTTDSSNAVLTNQKYIGKETKDGRSVYHYKVGYDKAHLQTYVTALGTSLDSSKLNDWSKKANDGKKLSEMVDIKSLQDEVKNAKANYTFDVWVDAKTKVVHAVQFADPSDATSLITITQKYTGGSSYPLSMSFNGKGSTGEKSTGDIDFSIDTATNKVTGNIKGTEGSTSFGLQFAVTPSNDALHVTAPTDAESVNTIIGQLFGGLSASADFSDPSTFDLQSL